MIIILFVCFSHLVPNYYKLHEVCEIVSSAGTEIKLALLLNEKSDEAKTETNRVMEVLLQTHHFREARKFAALLGLPDDHITLKEVPVYTSCRPEFYVSDSCEIDGV